MTIFSGEGKGGGAYLRGALIRGNTVSGYAENEIYEFLFQAWPIDGPSYDNATKMFNIKSLCYQRINCDIFQVMVREM